VHPAGAIMIGSGGIIRGYLEGTSFTPRALQRLIAGSDTEQITGWRRLCGLLGATDAPRTAPVLTALRIAVVLAAALFAGVAANLRRRRTRNDGR